VEWCAQPEAFFTSGESAGTGCTGDGAGTPGARRSARSRGRGSGPYGCGRTVREWEASTQMR